MSRFPLVWPRSERTQEVLQGPGRPFPVPRPLPERGGRLERFEVGIGDRYLPEAWVGCHVASSDRRDLVQRVRVDVRRTSCGPDRTLNGQTCQRASVGDPESQHLLRGGREGAGRQPRCSLMAQRAATASAVSTPGDRRGVMVVHGYAGLSRRRWQGSRQRGPLITACWSRRWRAARARGRRQR